MVSREKSGADNGGRVCGSAPTVLIAVTSLPNSRFMATPRKLPANRATIRNGILGNSFLVSIPEARVTAAITRM